MGVEGNELDRGDGRGGFYGARRTDQPCAWNEAGARLIWEARPATYQGCEEGDVREYQEPERRSGVERLMMAAPE